MLFDMYLTLTKPWVGVRWRPNLGPKSNLKFWCWPNFWL